MNNILLIIFLVLLAAVVAVQNGPIAALLLLEPALLAAVAHQHEADQDADNNETSDQESECSIEARIEFATVFILAVVVILARGRALGQRIGWARLDTDENGAFVSSNTENVVSCRHVVENTLPIHADQLVKVGRGRVEQGAVSNLLGGLFSVLRDIRAGAIRNVDQLNDRATAADVARRMAWAGGKLEGKIGRRLQIGE